MGKLKELTSKYIDGLIEEQRDGYFCDLKPFESHKSQIFENLSLVAESYQNSVKLGYKTLLKELAKERELNHDVVNLRPFDEFLIKKENMLKGETETMQEKVNLSIEVLRDMYDVSVNLFNEKKYEDARNILIFLLFLNPQILSFWIALGLVFESEQDQNAALESYKMAIIVDTDDQQGYDNAIRCCIDLEKWSDAEIILDAGIEILGEASDSEETLELQEHLAKLKTLVEQQQGGE